MSQFSFGYTWLGIGGQKAYWTKAHQPNMSPSDRNRNPDKSPPTCFPYVAIRAYYSRAFLSPSLHTLPLQFASRCRIQNNTRQQCLPVCFIFSPSHEMARFVSLSHNKRDSTERQCLYEPQLHTKWQCLPLSHIEHHRDVNVCLSESY